MYCKNCKYYSVDGGSYGDSACKNEKLREAGYSRDEPEGDELIYPYNEGGIFSPQPNFGCIHFDSKELGDD